MPCSDVSIKKARFRAGLLVLLSSVLASLTNLCGAALVTEFPIPIVGTQPQHITLGSDGALWFAAYNGNYIGRVTTDGSVTNFNVLKPASQPFGIAVGPDNNLWFTEFNGSKIGCITTNGVLVGEFSLPKAGSRPAGIVRGPDNRLWFTEREAGKIGAIATNAFAVGATGFFNEYPVPTTNSYPFHIASGPDGNLWFTETGVGKIGRITPAGVVINEYQFTTNCQPFDIVTGADGALWFTEYFGNKIGRISPAGATNEYAMLAAGRTPYGLTLGKDGNIWFAEYAGGLIGRLAVNATNATNFSITEFAIPSASVVTPNPTFLATGSHGSIWFTEFTGNNIGRISDNLLSVTVTNIYLTNGMSYSGTVATFQDSDPVTSPTNFYSASINWGDGTTNSGTVITNASGGFKVNAAHTYTVLAVYQVTVTITDNDTARDMGGAMVAATFSINPGPSLRIVPETNAQVIISWPTNDTGFQLQANTNLNTTNWTIVTNNPARIGTNFTVTNKVLGNKFYRLKR